MAKNFDLTPEQRYEDEEKIIKILRDAGIPIERGRRTLAEGKRSGIIGHTDEVIKINI